MNRRRHTNIVNWRRARRLRLDFQSRPSLGIRSGVRAIGARGDVRGVGCLRRQPSGRERGLRLVQRVVFGRHWGDEGAGGVVQGERIGSVRQQHGNVWEWVQDCWDALVRGYAVGRKPLAALGVRRACFARRLPGRQSEVPPRRAPGPGFRRRPHQQPRVPRRPDACPRGGSIGILSGVDGGWSSSRNLDAAYREDMTLQSILRTIYPCTIPKGGKP